MGGSKFITLFDLMNSQPCYKTNLSRPLIPLLTLVYILNLDIPGCHGLILLLGLLCLQPSILLFPEMSVNFRSDRDERRKTTFFQIS